MGGRDEEGEEGETPEEWTAWCEPLRGVGAMNEKSWEDERGEVGGGGGGGGESLEKSTTNPGIGLFYAVYMTNIIHILGWVSKFFLKWNFGKKVMDA